MKPGTRKPTEYEPDSVEGFWMSFTRARRDAALEELERFKRTYAEEGLPRNRAVLQHYDEGEKIEIKLRIAQSRANRAARRAEKGRGRRTQGHPAKQGMTAERKRQLWHNPDEHEAEIRRIIRKTMKEPEHPEDGELQRLLMAVAKLATPTHLADFGLDSDDHTAPWEQWCKHRLGLALKFPDPDGYLEWREAMRQKVKGASDANH